MNHAVAFFFFDNIAFIDVVVIVVECLKGKGMLVTNSQIW